MRYIAQQLELITHAIRRVWASCYQGTILPGMSKGIGETGARAYASLIDANNVKIYDDYAVVSMGKDGLEEAHRIQNGYAPFDMKPGFLNSPKARINKSGKKYFVMGFRHATPTSTKRLGSVMDAQTYKKAKTGESFKGSTVGMRTKKAGLINISSEKLGGVEKMPADYKWATGIYAGMQKTGGENHTTYRTFRIITEDSPAGSWWHPGQDPNDVVGSVVRYVQPFLKQGLEQAAKNDVVDLINQAFNR